MSITSGYNKYKRYTKLSNGTYKLVSQWTNSNTVEMDNGSTLQATLGNTSISRIGDGTVTGAIDSLNSKIITNTLQKNIYNNGNTFQCEYFQIDKTCVMFIQIYGQLANNTTMWNVPKPSSEVIRRTVAKHADGSVGRIRFTVSTGGVLKLNSEEYDKAVTACSIGFVYTIV